MRRAGRDSTRWVFLVLFVLSLTIMILGQPRDLFADCKFSAKDTLYRLAVAVPPVEGLPTKVATSTAVIAGLKGIKVTSRVKTTVKSRDGKVKTQDPAAGQLLNGLDEICVTVWQHAVPNANVPNVVGKSVGEAKRAIEQARLQIGSLNRNNCNLPRPCKVIRQSPIAGTQVKMGDSVSLWADGTLHMVPQQLAPGKTEVQSSGAGTSSSGETKQPGSKGQGAGRGRGQKEKSSSGQ
jgi:hypothetical protein